MKNLAGPMLVVGAMVSTIGLTGEANAELNPPDLAIKLSDQSMAVVEIGGSDPVNLPVSGSILLTTDSARCAVAPVAGCRVEVESLNIDFGDLPGVLVSVDNTQVANVDLTSNNVALTTQLPAVHSGTYFSAGSDANVISTTKVYGEIQGDFVDDAYLSEWGVLPADFTFDYAVGGASPYFTFEGEFPFTFSMNGDSLSGTVTIIATGETPFFNTMPVAAAGDDVDAECASAVELDASGTVDHEGDVISYQWFVGTELIGSGERISYSPRQGSTEVRLVVTDEKGSTSEDTLVITAAEGLPRFTSVPGNVTAASCGVIDIGEAEATSACGDITVASNAPTSFRVGTTEVIWTASSAAGSVEYVQLVTVSVGESDSCCPVGANIIHGTSNDDHLVGTSGVDCIFGYGGQDTIHGLGGDDVIHGGEGDDILVAGDGADFLDGGSGQDQLWGGTGNDTLVGSGGDDRLYGEGGDDVLQGTSGHNQCTGGSGFDTFLVCSATDAVESSGPPAFQPTSEYTVCECRPEKCSDCSSFASDCQGDADCAAIIECLQAQTSCNLPHECSTVCESGRSAASITLARNLASCFGGCGQ